MNDADLNANIGDHSRVIDGQNEAKMDHVHLDPSRWWFASSAFPMIAGTLGPVASAFSICALVKQWRQRIPPGSDVTKAVYVPDPVWLIVVNAIQLAIAIIANLALLLNMAKRLRFSIAQPVTIVGWYVSAICLVALSGTASGPLELQPVEQHVWSQAYYFGIFAAILYFIVASLMVFTVWGAAAGHYNKDFELSVSQRTLMLQTIAFLIYLLFGALVFSKVENWDYLDAVYWADVTLFTVGYGDISPQTRVGRGLLVPYAFIGVVSLGLVIGSIRSLMLDRGKDRLDARMLEKKRRQLVRNFRKKGKEELFKPIEGDERSESLRPTDSITPETELGRRHQEFRLMRKVQDQTSVRRRWIAMAISFSTWCVLWLVGAKIFQSCEHPYQGWTYFDAFYFSFTGLTTIGYGDLTPVSPGGKAFFVFWSLLALPTMTVLISNAGDTVVKWIRDGTLRLGNLTILPGESGFRKETKQLIAIITCGMAYSEYKGNKTEEDIPGFLGLARPISQRGQDPEKGKEDDSDEEKPKKSTVDTIDSAKNQTSPNLSRGKEPTYDEKRPVSQGEDLPMEFPKTRSEYHLVLIDEISRVTKHLKQKPPRRYSFKEWVWYLRLIGEDEASAETHAIPKHNKLDHKVSHAGHKSRHHQNNENGDNPEVAEGTGEKDEKHEPEGVAHIKWSWIGHQSPLMNSSEEAEWILDRLEQKLREELQAVVNEREGRDGLRIAEETEAKNEEEHGKVFDIGHMDGD